MRGSANSCFLHTPNATTLELQKANLWHAFCAHQIPSMRGSDVKKRVSCAGSARARNLNSKQCRNLILAQEVLKTVIFVDQANATRIFCSCKLEHRDHKLVNCAHPKRGSYVLLRKCMD